ncbi:MAG: IPT/TIG domain-containing protein [Alistipes sp.]|nr:IPT/TIG domain-containing protein [Alistipes sp.]
MLVGLLACSMMSCADNTLEVDIIGVKGEPHDASKPIEITDWSPKEGGSGQQMVVYGKNFGNDPSIIKVAIGGNEAVVVSAVGDAIYCLIPSKPTSDVAPDFNGTDDDVIAPEAQEPTDEPAEDTAAGFGLTVAVGPEGSMKVEAIADAFFYKKVLRVGTLLGKVNDKNELEVKDGPFEDCGNFQWPQMFAVDPLNENHLYVSTDGGDVRLIDFENEYVYTIIKGNTTPNNRIRSVSFCPTNILKRRQDGSIKELYPDFALDPYPADGDVGAYDLILSHDTWTQSNPTVTLYRRNRGGAYSATDEFGEAGYTVGKEAFANSDKFTVATGITCNGAYVHPYSGSLFYNAYSTAEMFKMDALRIFDGKEDRVGESQYKFGESGWEFNNVCHPDGLYMVMCMINRGWIGKSVYNRATDTFAAGMGYVGSDSVMGLGGGAGYLDDIGLSAKCNGPRQAIFVFNQEYADKGMEDQYDMYFTDSNNHCIRKVTPQGIVSTFAGRGNNGTWGYADGLAREEAQFNTPQAIAYNAARDEFYIGDGGNKRIRVIYWE